MTTPKTKTLTKDQILAKEDKLREIMYVPAPKVWGDGMIACRRMTQAQHDARMQQLLEKSKKDPKTQDRKLNLKGMKAGMLSVLIVDPETEQPLFSKEELDGMTSAAIEDLWKTVGAKCDVDLAKAIEKAEGNSESDRTG